MVSWWISFVSFLSVHFFRNFLLIISPAALISCAYCRTINHAHRRRPKSHLYSLWQRVRLAVCSRICQESTSLSPPAAVAMSDTCSEMSTMRMKFPKVPPLFLGRSLPAAWAATISAPTISSQGKQFDTPELTPRPG